MSKQTKKQYQQELKDKEEVFQFSSSKGGEVLLKGVKADAENAIFRLITDYKACELPVLLASIAKLEASLKIISTLTGSKKEVESIKLLIKSLPEETDE